ncbi:MAG: class I SAM-dependent methyltransferase [Colwellia sp.]|nr:class I SAM-dependent methyltransferase [Colwellia sp.]
MKQEITGSIYDIWEQGKNHGDSVTPSTWSETYKRMMFELLQRHAGETPTRILSLGCGNATIEADLVKSGHDVTGLDMNSEAVAYAAKKGLKTVEGDFYKYEPEEKFDIVYADGFFGHLCGAQGNVSHIYKRITQKMLKPKGLIIVSNDAPRQTGKEVQKHPHVPDFHFISANYLGGQAALIGLRNVEVNTFYYSRPVSGACPRAIVSSEFV